MPNVTEAFTISAECDGSTRSATRYRAGSAMVLADRWAEEGCQAIRLTDSKGAVRSREGFRLLILKSHQPAFS